jgi:hypothetical protein
MKKSGVGGKVCSFKCACSRLTKYCDLEAPSAPKSFAFSKALCLISFNDQYYI